MFNPTNSIFVWNDVQYVVKKQPSRLWPCQNCDLCGQCTAENFMSSKFPSCRAKHREDHQDVVFFEFTQQYRTR